MSINNYIMYLRKSRADDPNETVEEVLARHELILQNFAIAKFGEKVQTNNIYREVVSGETIEDRPVIKEVLNLIENDNLLGVLVVEPQRLTRGDMIDCGMIINAFKYSSTLIITPSKTFDLSDRNEGLNYDLKILKMELNNGSEYLEYTKEILKRGRNLSVEKGNYIGSIAPYGYDKTTINKEHTLKINDDEALAVKTIFQIYLEGNGYCKIAAELDRLGFKTRKLKNWSSSSIKDILSNEIYIGKIVWNYRKEVKIMKNGKTVKVRPRNDNCLIKDGKHPAIIDDETFQKVQERIGNNPRIKKDREMINPLSSLLYCKKCGRAMIYRTYKKGGVEKSKSRYLCSNQTICNTKSSFVDEIYESLTMTLESIVIDFEYKTKSNDKLYLDVYQKRIKSLNDQLDKIEIKQDELYNLLESQIYTRDVFLKRNDILSKEREKIKCELKKALNNAPSDVNYEQKILKFKNTIKSLKDVNIKIETKNFLLCELIERIEYSIIDNKASLDVILK